MINRDMREYFFYTIGDLDEYGQATISTSPSGKIKMAIHITNQSVQDNILYSDAQYIGITHAEIDDTFIIQYKDEKLKVLYVNPSGRYKQVFMVKM